MGGKGATAVTGSAWDEGDNGDDGDNIEGEGCDFIDPNAAMRMGGAVKDPIDASSNSSPSLPQNPLP
jgi:hypothetical protein